MNAAESPAPHTEVVTTGEASPGGRDPIVDALEDVARAWARRGLDVTRGALAAAARWLDAPAEDVGALSAKLA